MIATLFEDREATIWVSTLYGLDRFRAFAVATFSAQQGLSNALVWSALADSDGSVWLGTYGGLNRWDHGQIKLPRTGSGKPDGKLNGQIPNSLFQDDRGRIWIFTNAGVGYLEDDRFVPTSDVSGGPVHCIVEDKAGDLWIANQDGGLFRLSSRSEVQRILWARLEHKDYASALAVDPVQGGLWLGFCLGGVACFADGQVRASYAVADGLGEGWVSDLRFDSEGTLWAATEGGLSGLRNGRVATLTSTNGLPCAAVNRVIRDNDDSFWLYMPCGLVRVARSEVDGWTALVDQDKDTKRMVQAAVFGSSDGVRTLSAAAGFSPGVAKSSDGKLSFLPMDGVVDPSHLSGRLLCTCRGTYTLEHKE
jgi:ligand-binding sensor domain-containing protein